jgi:hypothetical protein
VLNLLQLPDDPMLTATLDEDDGVVGAEDVLAA